MAKPYVKRRKISVSANMLDVYRSELAKVIGTKAESLSEAKVCEYALTEATKLRKGDYNEKMTQAMYSRINRVIAEKIALYVEKIVPSAVAHLPGPDEWPSILIRSEGDPTLVHPLQREFVKPAAVVVQ